MVELLILKVMVHELFENHHFGILKFLQYHIYMLLYFVDDVLILNYQQHLMHIYQEDLIVIYDVFELVFDHLQFDRVRLQLNLVLKIRLYL